MDLIDQALLRVLDASERQAKDRVRMINDEHIITFMLIYAAASIVATLGTLAYVLWKRRR